MLSLESFSPCPASYIIWDTQNIFGRQGAAAQNLGQLGCQWILLPQALYRLPTTWMETWAPNDHYKALPKVEATIKERWDSRSKAQENLERFLSPNLILVGISWTGYSSLSCLRELHSWKERASCTWAGGGKEHHPANSSHRVCTEELWGSAAAQTSGCICFAHTVVSATQSRSAAWAALQGPPSEASSKGRIHSRGRNDSDVFVFLNWRLTTVNNKWEFCPVMTTVTQTLSSFLGSQ